MLKQYIICLLASHFAIDATDDDSIPSDFRIKNCVIGIPEQSLCLLQVKFHRKGENNRVVTPKTSCPRSYLIQIRLAQRCPYDQLTYC